MSCSAVGPGVTGIESNHSQSTLNFFRFISTGTSLALGLPSLVIIISCPREASSKRPDKLSFAARTFIWSGGGGSRTLMVSLSFCGSSGTGELYLNVLRFIFMRKCSLMWLLTSIFFNFFVARVPLQNLHEKWDI